jgi:hypothetical protein
LIQSYDTAYSKKETADFSVITTWGVFVPDADSGPNIILLDVVKGRWPEAEATIAKDAEFSEHYASSVIKGRWPEAEVRPLMGDSLLLLAAPSLLGPEPPQTLQQVLQLPLLHASENWATWLADVPEAHSGVQRPASHMSFTDSTHLLEATRLGMGVALSRRSIADQLLQRRELVQAHAHECPHASAYCLLLPQVSGKHPARDAFADWLQKTVT